MLTYTTNCMYMYPPQLKKKKGFFFCEKITLSLRFLSVHQTIRISVSFREENPLKVCLQNMISITYLIQICSLGDLMYD